METLNASFFTRGISIPKCEVTLGTPGAASPRPELRNSGRIHADYCALQDPLDATLLGQKAKGARGGTSVYEGDQMRWSRLLLGAGTVEWALFV